MALTGIQDVPHRPEVWHHDAQGRRRVRARVVAQDLPQRHRRDLPCAVSGCARNASVAQGFADAVHPDLGGDEEGPARSERGVLTRLLRRAYAARRRSAVPMRRQSNFGAARSEAATPRGFTNEAGFGWCRRLPVSILVVILGGGLLSACQPIPQSYYDWLAAGGGYDDGYAYAPLFHGHFINECRLPDADHPRDCRINGGRIGSSGIGSSDPAPFGHSLALSSGRLSGRIGGSADRGSGMTGHATSHGSGGASHGGHAGGGHGGHGGR